MALLVFTMSGSAWAERQKNMTWIEFNSYSWITQSYWSFANAFQQSFAYGNLQPSPVYFASVILSLIVSTSEVRLFCLNSVLKDWVC
jgi:hypothetical protein